MPVLTRERAQLFPPLLSPAPARPSATLHQQRVASAKPSLKTPSSPPKKKQGHCKKASEDDVAPNGVDQHGSPLTRDATPKAPASNDPAMSEVASGSTQGLGPRGGGAHMAALFHTRSNAPPLGVVRACRARGRSFGAAHQASQQAATSRACNIVTLLFATG